MQVSVSPLLVQHHSLPTNLIGMIQYLSILALLILTSERTFDLMGMVVHVSRLSDHKTWQLCPHQFYFLFHAFTCISDSRGFQSTVLI